MLISLLHQLKFPSHIAVTPSLWEDRLEEAFERKLSMYAGLVSDCQQAGCRARCFPVEVGCRGFAARSLARAFSSLGIEEERKRRAIRSTTHAAERAPRLLWFKRGEPWSHGSYDDVDQILEATAKGEADRKLQVMTSTIVSIAAERFGEQEEKKSSTTPYSMNQRAVKIHNIRQEIKSLKSQYKAAGTEERTGLAQLMCILQNAQSLAGLSGIGGGSVREHINVLLSTLTLSSSQRICWGRSAAENWPPRRKT